MAGDSNPKTSLFLADDDENERRILRECFAAHPDYEVVGEASDGAAAVEGCLKTRPDVALLDIQMPLLDGISAARLILDKRAAKCVVMLTAFSDREYVQGALDAGAFGYLTKPIDPQKLLPALEVYIARSKEYHLLKKEQRRLEQRLEERSMVDRAKLLLIECRGMSEDESYRYIRELSRRKCMSMSRVSEYLITQMEETHD